MTAARPDAGAPRARLVLFDFDGTLADSFGAFVAAWNGLARERGFRVLEGGAIETLRALEPRRVVSELGVPRARLPAVALAMRRRMAAEVSRVTLFPGVRPLLARLDEAGVAIAIVTSNGEGIVREVLGARDAARVAAWSCGAALLGKARRFRRVLRELGVPPEAALSVGDELRDLAAARAAGIPAAAVSWGFAARAALAAAAPDVLFDEVREIGDHVLGRGRARGA